MAIEDTWYDYYRGPLSTPSITEQAVIQARGLAATTGPASTPLSPAPSIAFDLQAGSDYALALRNDLRENERARRIREQHGRERRLIALILEILFQIAGFTCVIVFGIWAVKSYNVSAVALKVQTVANYLALRGLCSQDADLTGDGKCAIILAKSVDELMDPNIFSDALDGTGLNLPKLSLGAIVGIVIGGVAGLLFLNIIWAVWRRQRLLMQLNSHLGTDNLANPEAGLSLGAGVAAHSLNGAFAAMQKRKGTSEASFSTQSTAPTAYSGNPLTPNGPGLPSKQRM
ncbi:hypothetical protein DRE_01149 [Drechslerella stenobrocha 248]|uniref:Uncharacterized protein n=1 Tax=Drechslerella stenobrocha 248 TaxID=1043628 RepID=W7HWL6_9PEZI|nr:hypothetical protein DRE_01149 [Drechslerella stenobrocha 248]